MKKTFALMLALCMIFTFMPAAMAEAETGTISGDTLLYAPPKGQESAVSYQLKDANGSIVQDAVFTLNSAPDGVSLIENSLILNGTDIQSGAISLSAASSDGSVTAGPLSITVYKDRIFFDGTGKQGAAATTVKHIEINTNQETTGDCLFQVSGDASKVIVKKESDGNEYFYACEDSFVNMNPKWAGTNSTKVQHLTIAAKVMAHGEYAPTPPYPMVALGAAQLGYTLPDYSIFNYYDSNGTVLSGDMLSSGKNLSNTWLDMRIVLNYADHTYSVYLDEQLIWDDYKMIGTPNYLEMLSIRTSFDDLAIYSGDAIVKREGTIEGDSTLLAPPEGVTSKVSYKLMDSQATAQPIMEKTVWSYEGTLPTGVTVDDETGEITIVGSIVESGSFVLKAESINYTANKTITIPDKRYFEDFESQSVGAKFAVYSRDLSGNLPAYDVGQSHVAVESEEDTLQSDGINNFASITKWSDSTQPGDINYVNTKHEWGLINANYKTTTVSFRMKASVNGSNYIYDSAKSFRLASDKCVLSYSTNVNGDEEMVPTPATFNETGWTDVRIVTDYYAKTYSVYVDDFLAIKDEAMLDGSAGFLNQFYVFAPVDDYAFYTGEAVVEDYVTVDGKPYDFDTAPTVLSEGKHIVEARFGGNAATAEKKILILAHYDTDGKLADLDFHGIDCNGKYSLGARLNEVSGGKVKIMLWKGNGLVPLGAFSEIH